jgi:hypothetical protein
VTRLREGRGETRPAGDRLRAAGEERKAASQTLPEPVGTRAAQALRAHARDDLVTMKEEAGRPQDLIDIRALMMAEGLEE